VSCIMTGLLAWMVRDDRMHVTYNMPIAIQEVVAYQPPMASLVQ